MKNSPASFLNTGSYSVFLGIITILLIGCGVTEKGSVPAYDISIPAIDSIAGISDIATAIRYIPLSETIMTPVGKIEKIRISNGCIFVLSEDKIFCFDKFGNFLHILDKKGRGPGEYSGIRLFDIDHTGELLVTHTYGRLLIFKITNAGFIFFNDIKVFTGEGYELSALNFIPGTRNIILSYATEGIEKYRNVLINENGDTLSLRDNLFRYRPSSEMGFSSSEEVLQESNGSKLIFMELFNDTVYEIHPPMFVPQFIMRKGKDSLTPGLISSLNRESAKSIRGRLIIHSMMECNGLFLFRIAYRGDSYFEIIDRKSGIRYKSAGGLYINDDICGGVDILPRYSYGGKIYTWIDAASLLRSIDGINIKDDKGTINVSKQEFLKVAGSLNEDDNPVLIEVTIK